MLSHFKAFVWNRINGNATFFNPDVVTKFDVVAIGKYADKVEVQKELKNNFSIFLLFWSMVTIMNKLMDNLLYVQHTNYTVIQNVLIC